MTELMFKDYLVQKYKDWENDQPKKISTVTAFARWLSNNSFNVEIKQQVVDSWRNGVIPKDEKYIAVLAEKLGDEVYVVLQRPPVDLLLLFVQDNWGEAPKKEQKRIADTIAKYSGKPLPNEKRESSPTKPR